MKRGKWTTKVNSTSAGEGKDLRWVAGVAGPYKAAGLACRSGRLYGNRGGLVRDKSAPARGAGRFRRSGKRVRLGGNLTVTEKLEGIAAFESAGQGVIHNDAGVRLARGLAIAAVAAQIEQAAGIPQLRIGVVVHGFRDIDGAHVGDRCRLVGFHARAQNVGNSNGSENQDHYDHDQRFHKREASRL